MARSVSGALTWAASAAAGTVQTLVAPEGAHNDQDATVFVFNPSTVTALNVSCRVRWADGTGANRDAELMSFSVPVNSSAARVVDNMGMGIPLLHVTNATALGLGQGFTAQARIQFAQET